MKVNKRYMFFPKFAVFILIFMGFISGEGVFLS
jgi:hypothetical protein